MKTMKFALTAVAVLGAGAATAQEFGKAPVAVPAAASATVVQQPNGALAQDQAQKDAEAPASQFSDKPADTLAAFMNDPKNNIQPYDKNTGRIVVQSTVTFDVLDPEVSADFIEERNSRMMELLLNAKGEIVKSICSQMSAERLLELPANPIRKQLEDRESAIRKSVDKVKKQLDEAGIALDEAKLDTTTLSAPELMAAAAEVYNGEYASKLDEEKKARFEASKNTYNALKAEYDALVKQAEQVQNQFRDSVTKSTRSSISLSADMQIHGCSLLEQTEGAFIQNGKWKYQISALFSWSEASQKAAEAILAVADPDANVVQPVKFAPAGKRTVSEWISNLAKKGALAYWSGPRTYIDKNGDMWYLGIYATPVRDDAIEDEKAQKAAALLARAEVGYALFAQLNTTNALEEAQIDFKVDGANVTKKLRDYNEKTKEQFQDLTLFGLSKIGPTYDLKHKSGHDIHVVVYGINASNAREMKSIQDAAHKLGIKINTAQQFEFGRQEQMRRLTEMSRDNAEARNAGARQALGEAAAALLPTANAVPQNTPAAPPTVVPPATVPQRPGLRPGVQFIRNTDDF